MIETGIDVVTFLKRQHDDIKLLFQGVLLARGETRELEFRSLRRVLAIHEAAEETVVHPAARKTLPVGDRTVDIRLAEENSAKRLLGELEGPPVDSVAFERGIRELRHIVVSHAVAEEQEEFVRLGVTFDALRLARMRRVAELVERFAPTRPHAGVESATASLLVGPFAAMMDRARDALTERR
jgi:hypothetical protein